MNKFKRFGVSILSLGLVLALNPVTTFAAEPETSVVTSESNAVGGWSEEDSYFFKSNGGWHYIRFSKTYR